MAESQEQAQTTQDPEAAARAAAQKQFDALFEGTRVEGALPDGRMGSFDAEGKLREAWKVDEYGDRVADADGEAASGTESSPAPEPGAAGEEPKAAAEDPRIAKLEAELARYRAAAPHDVPPVETRPPERRRPALDLADMPDPNDVEKYPKPEDAKKALEEYFTRKHTEALDVSDRAARAADERRAAEAERERTVSVMRGVLDETIRLSGMEHEAGRQAVVALGQHTTPGWKGGEDPQNFGNHILTNVRTKFMSDRAAARLPLGEHESVPELVVEQLKDKEFAQAVSQAFPRTPASAAVLGMMAYTERPTRLLRHFTGTDEGKKELGEMLAVDVERIPAHLRDSYMSEMGRRLTAVDARLAAAPAPKQEAKQVKDKDGALTPPPELPSVRTGVESMPSLRGSVPAPEASKHEVWSDEWTAEQWPAVVKESIDTGSNGWYQINV